MAYKQKSMKLNMILNGIKGVMAIIFPLISFPYVSKILGVENLGKYNFSNSIISYFVLFAGLGISTYAIREGAKVREHRAETEIIAAQLFTINVVATIVSYLLLILLVLFIPFFQSYRILLAILSLQVIFKTMGIEWVYSIYEDYLYITVRSILVQIVSLLLLFALVHTEQDLYKYAMITVIANGGANLFNFFHARKFCTIRFTRDTDFRKHIKPILILFATVVTTTIYVSSDNTILGFLSGDRSVGIYSVAVKIYTIVKNMLSSILIVSIPRLSAMVGSSNKDGFKFVAEDIYKTLLSIVTPAILGIILLRKEMVLILSNETFLNATTPLVLLSIALLFCLGAWFWGQCILVTNRKERIVLRATISSAIINVVLNLILIPFWQEKAAALTTLIAEATAFFWCKYHSRTIVRLNGIYKVIAKIAIGCMAEALVVIGLRTLILNQKVFIIVAIIGSVVIYFLLEILLKNEAIYGVIESIRNKVFKRK